MRKYIVSSSEYRHIVEVAKKVNSIADDVHDKDQKRKFLMRSYPPTVEQLEEHHVDEHLEQYFSYLVYYHEPALCSFLTMDEELESLQYYIDDLFKDAVHIEEEKRENGPLLLKTDKYDLFVSRNSDACRHFIRKLNPYEMESFLGGMPLTLERLQSMDPAKNLERFLPFLVRMTEPSLYKKIPQKEKGIDFEHIRKYLKDLLLKNLDFQEDEDA